VQYDRISWLVISFPPEAVQAYPKRLHLGFLQRPSNCSQRVDLEHDCDKEHSIGQSL